MYGSTSIRWIVQMLMLNRTYKRQSWSGAFDQSSVLYPSILHAAIVANTNVNLNAAK